VLPQALAASFPSRVARSFLADECPFLAGAVAYQIFFSLVPLLAVVVGVLGFIYRDTASQLQLAQVLRQIYPSATDREIRIVRDLVQGRALSIGIGVAGTLLGASAIFGSLDSAFAAVLGRGHPRSLVRRYLSAFAFVAALTVLALGSVTISYGAVAAADVLLSARGEGAARLAVEVVGRVVGAATGAVFFFVIYRSVPRRTVAFETAAIAAVVSALLWELAKLAFGEYARVLGAFSAYGPLAFAAGLLTWIYLTAVIILFGAEVIKVKGVNG
jgi:membrane protein